VNKQPNYNNPFRNGTVFKGNRCYFPFFLFFNGLILRFPVRIVKFKAFAPFTSAENALENINAISEGS